MLVLPAKKQYLTCSSLCLTATQQHEPETRKYEKDWA